MSHRTQNLTELIDQSPLSRLQIRVLVLCFLVVLLDGFDTAAIGYIAPELLQSWHIERAQLAPVFGAGLFGMLLGSFCFGPLADRHGRKSVLLVCVLIFALGTLASALSPSVEVLAVLRFITGIGLGGVLPNCITLSSEYSPARRRMLLVTLSYSGFTLGLALGGAVAGVLLPLVGWQGLLVIGGLAPLLLWPVLWLALPESVCFMADSPRHQTALRRTVERISGREDWHAVRFIGDAAQRTGHSSVSALFSQGQMARTLLLWLTFFCCLFVFYLLTNWLPTVLRGSGYSTANAAQISAMIPLGGVLGGIAMALLMDRLGALRVLPLLCLTGAVALACTGSQLEHGARLLAIVFLAGFCLTGTLNNLSVLAATLYPTRSRATGVSWALAAGRAGSIIGSMLGGWIFSSAGDLPQFFIWIAVPVLIASLALLLMNSQARHQAAPLES
ncbi:MFS transporter [Pseudomonas sp. CF161]|uniref:MFS transporter n=1 Tax=Pseudomonas sp. CF161 TaxID=911241 RepID=UPI00035509D8|nr:MFS transporter [Pseudomonas sp. CF161]EPL09810.1 major facilitator transporter [Pseudomonas sp. CF161]